MYGHTGPLIQEIDETPTEGSTAVRDWTTDEDVRRLGKEVQKLTCQEGFTKNANLMRRLIELLEKQVDEWKEDQDIHGHDHCRQQKIQCFEKRIADYKKKCERSIRRYCDQRDSRTEIRRERARDVHHNSNYDITDRGDSIRLNQHYHRQSLAPREESYHSSDDDEENIPPRLYRSGSPPPSASYSRSTMYQQRQDDSNVHYRSHHSTLGASSSQQVRMRSGKSRVTKTHNRKWRPGQKALAEIRKYQKSTDMLIQKAPFARLVHEIIQEATSFSKEYRIRADALMALQEASEAFMVEMFEGSVLICNHAKRVTLMPTDIQLYRRLCLRNLS